MREYKCTRCGALLNIQEGFNSNSPMHECHACGAKMYDPNIYQGERFKGVYWHCDRCGALLNIQNGFRDVYDSWKCTGCSYLNQLSENEIEDLSMKSEIDNNKNNDNQENSKSKEQYIIYCNNCGKPLNPGAKFCLYCGKSQYNSKSENNSYNTERKNVYVGEVRKCPSCGAELNSFSAICPHCVHELNSVEVPESIKEFSEELSCFDNEIANSPNNKPWKRWSGAGKFWWVILNIFTFCVPLLIYLFLSIGGYGGFGKLSPVECKKETYINNYSFPNDRESVLEALFFIKSQVVSLSSESKNGKNKKWIKIWKNKAKELLNKSKLLFKDDPIASNIYNDIKIEEKKVKRVVLLKSMPFLLLAAICCILLVLPRMEYFNNSCVSCASCDFNGIHAKKTAVPTINDDTVSDEKNGIFSYPIRNYIGKNAASFGKIDNGYLIEEYGEGKLRFIFVTKDGTYMSGTFDERKKYTVVGQSIPVGTNLIEVHSRYSDGKVSPYSVSYQNYDEIVLYVSPINDNSYKPNVVSLLPTLDRHKYHIRDYKGRNLASFGRTDGEDRVDEYGEAELKIEFVSEDGSFVNVKDYDDLRQYVVINQDIEMNTELIISYSIYSSGEESDYSIQSQNIERITLTVKNLMTRH